MTLNDKPLVQSSPLKHCGGGAPAILDCSFDSEITSHHHHHHHQHDTMKKLNVSTIAEESLAQTLSTDSSGNAKTCGGEGECAKKGGHYDGPSRTSTPLDDNQGGEKPGTT